MTIVKRGDSWGVKVWDAGRKRYRWVGSYRTEAEAKRAESDASLRPLRDTPSVEQWARVWLSDYARPSAATRMVYRQEATKISSELGRMRLNQVDRPMARRIANNWPRNRHAVARSMWADARRDGIVDENPWSDLRLKQSRGRKDIQPLTEIELNLLSDVAQDAHGGYGPIARAIVLTLGYTAIRPGELCALRWENVDLVERDIMIRRSLDATGVEKLPKNGKERVSTIPTPVVGAIAKVPRMLDDPYVFHTVTGRRLTKPNLWYMWRPIMAAWTALGHERFALYELRHVGLTLMLERGLSPSDVAVQAGHEDGGALIMARYGHPSKDRARERIKDAFADETSQHMRRTGAA